MELEREKRCDLYSAMIQVSVSKDQNALPMPRLNDLFPCSEKEVC